MFYTMIERLAEQFPDSYWSQLWRQVLAREAL